jgi:hypothetical protein
VLKEGDVEFYNVHPEGEDDEEYDNLDHNIQGEQKRQYLFNHIKSIV